jgi:hypothetical protein
VDRVTLDTLPWRLGEEDYIGCIFRDVELSASLSTATATVEIYDSTGATTLSSTAMTLTGTDRRVAKYFLTSGSAKTITAAGVYRAIYRATWSDGTNSIIREAQQQIDVRARPSS